MAKEKHSGTIRNWLVGGGIALAGLGTVTYVATRPDNKPQVQNKAAVDEDDVTANAGAKPQAKFEAIAKVDVRDFALSQETPPNAEGDPRLMQFVRQTLPEGNIDLQIDAKQAFQLANITNDKGKLRALVLPKKDGDALILELQPTTKVRLTVHMGKDKEAAPAIQPGNKADFEFGGDVHWVKDLAEKIEKNNATKGAVNTNAVQFFNNELGGLVGNYAATLEQKRLSKDATAPEGFKSSLNKDTRLNWDPYAEKLMVAKLNPTRAKE